MSGKGSVLLGDEAPIVELDEFGALIAEGHRTWVPDVRADRDLP